MRKNLSYRLSHVFIRLLSVFTTLTFAIVLIADPHPRTPSALARLRLIVYWSLLSIIFFPLYIVFERLWMGKNVSEDRAITVDAVFVILWIILALSIFLYGLTQYATL